MRSINANSREDVGDPIANIPEERFRELYRLPPNLARSFLDEMIALGLESDSPISLEHQVSVLFNLEYVIPYNANAILVLCSSQLLCDGLLPATNGGCVSDEQDGGWETDSQILAVYTRQNGPFVYTVPNHR